MEQKLLQEIRDLLIKQENRYQEQLNDAKASKALYDIKQKMETDQRNHYMGEFKLALRLYMDSEEADPSIKELLRRITKSIMNDD